MDIDYFLTDHGQRIFLFSLPYEHTNEEVALFDFELKFRKSRDLSFEDKVRKAYRLHFRQSLLPSSPFELLRILLANGFDLKSNLDETLLKSFFPVRFEAKSPDKTIKIGDYYRTSVANAKEQFTAFCNWSDVLCGFPGMSKLMVLHFTSAGFAIFGAGNTRDSNQSDVLIHDAGTFKTDPTRQS